MDNSFNTQEIITLIDKIKAANECAVDILCVSELPEQIKTTLQSLGIRYKVIPSWLAAGLNKNVIYIVPKYILPKCELEIRCWEDYDK